MRAAQAGRRAAERLDLRGVVVRLILELDQPILGFAVDGDGHLDGAGVDLLALVEIRHKAAALERLRADDSHIHEGDGAIRLAVHLVGAPSK